MFTGNVEAIRQCLVSLLVDSEDMKRKVDRVFRDRNQTQHSAAIILKRIAERIDHETRELYHLLPESLRPIEMPRPQKPREPNSEGLNERKHPGPKPGKPIPREVRWPSWTIDQILTLADLFHTKYGKWPNRNSGRITAESPDTWGGIDLALKRGNRNLPGGTTLARLLAEHRGVRHRCSMPKLDIEQILVWADEHYVRTGSWPTVRSGLVIGAPDETWSRIDHALRHSHRGITTPTSLVRLLAERRGVPYSLGQEDLTIEQILDWADAHYKRTGKWPTHTAGVILEAPHESWSRIDDALIVGNRSLPGGSSLARLLAEYRGVRNRKALPTYDIETLLCWVDHHYERHGRCPSVWSGAIEAAPGETWGAVDSAFKAGRRGLAGCGYRSLAHLLDERRGALRRHGNHPTEHVLLGTLNES